MIRGLCRDSLLPWCIIGDFNELAREEDKRGGAAHPPWVNKGLREIISDCSLQDSGLEGHLFMWARGLGTEPSVEERLDKALVSNSWFVMFPQVRLRNLVSARTDHTPIELSTCSRPVHHRQQPFTLQQIIKLATKFLGTKMISSTNIHNCGRNLKFVCKNETPYFFCLPLRILETFYFSSTIIFMDEICTFVDEMFCPEFHYLL